MAKKKGMGIFNWQTGNTTTTLTWHSYTLTTEDNITGILSQGSSCMNIECNPNIQVVCISRYWPQTPKTQSLACIPGNVLLVCETLSLDDPRNSSPSAAQGFWFECMLSYHLAKLHPKSLLLACQQTGNHFPTLYWWRPAIHHRYFPSNECWIQSLLVYSPVKPFSLRRLIFIIRVNDDLLAPEVDNFVKIESRHAHFTGKEDGSIS